MRKVLLIVLSVLFVFGLFGCFFEEVSLLYSDHADIDGFYIAINKTANCCFVGDYDCTEYAENYEITIPDDYGGMPIKRIGGYYGSGVPTPFSISLDELYMNAPTGSKYSGIFGGDIDKFDIPDAYVVEDVVFTLNIGENIETVEFVVMDHYFPHINEDSSVTFFHPVVYINCSEENKYFYSQDGKLYDKKTDELISDFAYQAS
jgi:hypothetical protein